MSQELLPPPEKRRKLESCGDDVDNKGDCGYLRTLTRIVKSLGNDSEKLEFTVDPKNCRRRSIVWTDQTKDTIDVSFVLDDDEQQKEVVRKLSIQSTTHGPRFKNQINLPAEIETLKESLEVLEIDGDFVSEIPDQIGTLTNLKTLKLCNVNGRVPSTIGNLLNLKELSLSGIHDTDIADTEIVPSTIGNLLNLKKLSLSHSYALPEVLGNLTSLEYLHLEDITIGTTVNSVCNLVNLKKLYMHQVLTYFSLEKLTQLESLHLDDTAFVGPWTEQDDQVGNYLPIFTNLQQLILSPNESGILSVPGGIGSVTNLKVVRISWCEIPSLLNTVGNLWNLEELSIYKCTGLEVLPEGISNLAHLKILSFRESEQIVSLPDSLGNLANLKELDLHSAKVPTLPNSIGNLTNLEKLDLTYNDKLITLPDEIGNLTSLKELNLHGTKKLGPRLPNSIVNLSNLEKLSLYCNTQLKALPDAIGNLTNLKDLNLSHANKLNALPDTIGNLTNLKDLNVARTNISFLPSSIGGLSSLERLNISRNFKLESLPYEIGNLTRLDDFNINDTNIASLPNSFGNLSNLKSLRLLGTPLYTNTTVLARILQDCPKLGHFGMFWIGDEDDECAHNLDSIRYALIRNRIRVRVFHPLKTTEPSPIPLSLWPLIFARMGAHSFGRDEEYTDKYKSEPLWLVLKNQADPIFWLLQEHGKMILSRGNVN